MRKRLTIMSLGVMLILALVLTASGCGGGGGGQSVIIGHPICLSGTHAKAGEQASGGVQACLKWINDVHGGVNIGGEQLTLEYISYDCESKKETVTSLIERLITVNHVDFILAPYSSGLTLAGASVAEQYGVVYMDHGGASDRIFEQGYEYAVQTIGPGRLYHVGTLDMIHEVDPSATRVALAYEESEFARMVMDGAEAHAEDLGFEVVFAETYPEGVTDLTPLLSDLKATEPDIILGGGHYEDGQLLCRQVADLDINVSAISLIASATLPAFYEALTCAAEGVMGPSHWEYGVTYSAEAAQAAGLEWFGPSQDEFLELFQEVAGEDLMPDYHAAEAGAAVLALVMAAEKADSLDSDTVRDTLGDLHFMSFYGGWDVDDTGLQVGHSMVDVQWQDGERVIIWPVEAQIGELCYPIPTIAEREAGAKAIPD